jgi:hypothetical protein
VWAEDEDLTVGASIRGRVCIETLSLVAWLRW